jgi:hypothetical protein
MVLTWNLQTKRFSIFDETVIKKKIPKWKKISGVFAFQDDMSYYNKYQENLN